MFSSFTFFSVKIFPFLLLDLGILKARGNLLECTIKNKLAFSENLKKLIMKITISTDCQIVFDAI